MESIQQLQDKIKEETKICSGCNIDKPKSEYHKCSNKLTGVQSKCKICMSDMKKVRYWLNRDEELVKLAKSRNNPENLKQRKEYYQKNKEQYK